MAARFINKALEAEMDTHLGYKKYERKPDDRQAGGVARFFHYIGVNLPRYTLLYGKAVGICARVPLLAFPQPLKATS